MLLIAMIELNTGDAPADVAESVLARLEDEAGYDKDAAPYTPGAVTVYALTGLLEGANRNELAHRLDAAADAAARRFGDGTREAER